MFGRVVDGEDVVQNIESIPVNETMSRPLQDVKIANCGELVLKSKREYFMIIFTLNDLCGFDVCEIFQIKRNVAAIPLVARKNTKKNLNISVRARKKRNLKSTRTG